MLTALAAIVLAAAVDSAAAPPLHAIPEAAPDSGNSPGLHFDRPGGSLGIPIQVRNNHILFSVRLNGRDSVTFVLDSGAAGSILARSFAESTGLALGEEHETRGAGGTAMSASVHGVTVALPGVTLDPGTYGTLPVEGIGGADGHPVQGILGRPLFEHAVVRLDYARSVMDLYDPATWTYDGKGVVLPLTFEEGLPYVKGRVKLPGKSPATGRFVLDTGSVASLIVAADWAEAHDAIAAVGPTIEVVNRGVGGEVRNRLGRVEWLELGGVRLASPLSSFRSAGGGYTSHPGSVGNIGGQILRRFTVIFDYPHRRLILEPNEEVTRPFVYDASGISLRTQPPECRTVVAGTIIAASPAAEIGVRTGDVIETIDGRPSGDLGVDAVRALFRTEGATYRLVVLRGGERLELSLTTRRLI